MTTCPNCNHSNSERALQCESCLTPLATLHCCPNCGAATVPDARFCGQCGFNVQSIASIVRVMPLAVFPSQPLIPNLSGDDGGAAAMPTLNLNTLSVDRISRAGTAIQLVEAHLHHLQTQTQIELSFSKLIIHIGKPNDRIPPDIDVSGFPNAEIVSRIHANIRLEGDAYYLEDVGSSNGTYINNNPLTVGSRHRLRGGDRISLGKGDKVTFQFQVASASG
jgi:FHA domain/Double zinc ribbon